MISGGLFLLHISGWPLSDHRLPRARAAREKKKKKRKKEKGEKELDGGHDSILFYCKNSAALISLNLSFSELAAIRSAGTRKGRKGRGGGKIKEHDPGFSVAFLQFLQVDRERGEGDGA